MERIPVVPESRHFFATMSSFTYDMAAAVSDIIDNSISAKARNIVVWPSWNDGEPTIAVLDDGFGMSRHTLTTRAMRFDCSPDVTRAEGDLGKYSLGMKTASFSQGRRLTVTTKEAEGETSSARWDIDELERSKSWDLLVDVDRQDSDLRDRFDRQASGTLVLIEKISRYGTENEEGSADFFNDAVADMRRHLARTFHRYIESGVSISVGLKHIEADDPCKLASGKAHLRRERSIRLGRGASLVGVIMDPTLEMDDDENRVYVYRQNRLIIEGGWNSVFPRLFRNESSADTRLARLVINIHPDDDRLWGTNVQKNSITPPAEGGVKSVMRDYIVGLKDESRRILSGNCGTRAGEGEPEAVDPWIVTGQLFRPLMANRAHPVIAKELAGRNGKAIARFLSFLEDSLPPVITPQVSTVAVSEAEVETDLDPLDGVPHEIRQNLRTVARGLAARKSPEEIAIQLSTMASAVITTAHVEHLTKGR